MYFRTGVRLPSPPPRRSKRHIACSDLFYKSERAHSAAPPFQIEPAPLGFNLVLGVDLNIVLRCSKQELYEPLVRIALVVSAINRFGPAVERPARKEGVAMDKGIIRIIEEKGARSDLHDRGDGIRVRKTLRPVRQRHSGVPFHRPGAGAELYGKEYVKRTLQKEGATI